MGINPGNPAFALPPGEDSLVRQVKDLERTTRENLASVVSSFKTTVERLDAAILAVQEVVDAQVLPKVATGTGSGFLVTGEFQTFASAIVPVPAGYSRALVIASGQVTGGNDANMAVAKIYAHITINGVAGDDSTVNMVNMLWATAPAFGSATLSGLNGGVITIATAGRLSVGHTSDPDDDAWNNATLAAQVLFLR